MSLRLTANISRLFVFTMGTGYVLCEVGSKLLSASWMNVVTQIRGVRIKYNEQVHKLHTPSKIIVITIPKNFEMARANCAQIISRIDYKEDKTLKTKEQMTDMDLTEIVQESMDGIKRAEGGGHW